MCYAPSTPQSTSSSPPPSLLCPWWSRCDCPQDEHVVTAMMTGEDEVCETLQRWHCCRYASPFWIIIWCCVCQKGWNRFRNQKQGEREFSFNAIMKSGKKESHHCLRYQVNNWILCRARIVVGHDCPINSESSRLGTMNAIAPTIVSPARGEAGAGRDSSMSVYPAWPWWLLRAGALWEKLRSKRFL